MYHTEDISRDALERMVIATLIQDQEAAGELLTGLQETDFSHPAWQGLFLAARRLHGEGLPIIEGTLVAFYGEDGQLFSAYAADAARMDTPADFRWTMDQLRQRVMLESLKTAAQRLTVAENMEEAADIVSKINALSCARQGVKITRLGDATAAYVGNIGKQAPDFIKFGLRIFDDEVFLRKGKYFVLGGYASSGKTLLTLQMAQHIGLNYKVGYFSFETDDEDIAARTLSYRSGVHNKKILRHKLTDAELEQLRKAAKATGKMDVELIQASGMTAEDIRALTLARKYDVIFVDYLQSVRGQSARGTMYENVSDTSRTLQTLSRTGNVLVVALSQLSRPETRKDGKLVQPTMSSLRESGQIEQDADVIALLYPENMDDNRSNRIFRLAKNKDGEKLDLLMAFMGQQQRLEVIGHRNKGAEEPKQEVRASDGSGSMFVPDRSGESVPESFYSQMAF